MGLNSPEKHGRDPGQSCQGSRSAEVWEVREAVACLGQGFSDRVGCEL